MLALWYVRYVEKVQESIAEWVIWREDSCLLSIDEGLPLSDGLQRFVCGMALVKLEHW